MNCLLAVSYTHLHDEGIQENGRECICLKTVRNKLRYAEFCREFPLEDYSFDNFSLAYYTSEKEKSKMQFIYDTCKTYADHFPKDARNLLLSGGTGLGKTHLSLAIAREVINKGYQVLYNSAQNFLSSVQQETFGKVPPGALENLLSCDLLIIDDLGVEFSTQFSISAIYNIINTRSINKRRTIINTNLSLEEVEEKYGERIFSRLVGCYDWLRFVGKDIRIQKKAKTTKQ